MHARYQPGPSAVVGRATMADAWTDAHTIWCAASPRCSPTSAGMTLRPGGIVPEAPPRVSNQSTPGDVVEAAVEGIAALADHVKDWTCGTQRRQAP